SLWIMLTLPSEFVPTQDQSRLMIRLSTAVGSSLDESDALFKKAEAYVGSRDDVTRVFCIVGGFGGGDVNTGIMFVTLVPPGDRELDHNEVGGEIRAELSKNPGLRAIVQDVSQQGFSARRGFPVEFSVRGPDFETL